MTDPRVTLIIPAFNAAGTLEQAVASLQAQTLGDWRAILVDDGSTDGTGAVCARLAAGDARLDVVGRANGGEAAARNSGLALAGAEWVAFLDADDWVLPTWLEEMLAAAAAEPGVGLVHCGWVRVTADGREGAPNHGPPGADLFPQLARYNCFAVHACLVRRSLVETVGGFDESLRTCPDWDLWQRVARAGVRTARVPRVLAAYRVSAGSAGMDAARILADGLEVIARGHRPDPRVPEPAPEHARGMEVEALPAAQLEFAGWAAGLAIGAGQDPRGLLTAFPGLAGTTADPDRVAGKLFEAVPLAAGAHPGDWPRLWPGVDGRLETFLADLEDRRGLPGLAGRVRSALWRRIVDASLGTSGRSGEADVSGLEEARAWHERQAARWQAIAREREAQILELQGWIAELEAAKQWLSGQRDAWQRLAEERRAPAPMRWWRRWSGASTAEGAPPRAPQPGRPVEPALGEAPIPAAPVFPTEPLSREWGFDRGLPVDRYYIERFLERHAADVRGRVLEVGDDTYTRRFGGDRVERRDVLHVTGGNPQATFVGDLTRADHLPDDAFDCVILTQTLQLIYDVPSALRTVRRILKPGGVLLATVPGITRTSATEWPGSWFWRFTPASARRLLDAEFPADCVDVCGEGNVRAAAAFLYGQAAGELAPADLDRRDADYDVVVSVRAVKPGVAAAPAGRATGRAPAHASGREEPARGVVLLYHRVATDDLDPWRLSVSPDRFADQLAALQREATVVRLADLATDRAGPGTKTRVAITFDDGYSDNLYDALPHLEDFDVPATVFVCTGAVAAGAEFWWDELERLLLRPNRLPPRLRLELDDEDPFIWELGGVADYPAEQARAHLSWLGWEPPPTPRHALFAALWDRLRRAEPHARDRAMARLVAWAGSAAATPPRHRALARSELVRLAGSRLIDIGAHTVGHPSLSALSPAGQQQEIASSRAWLAGLLGREPAGFSYPFGQPADYDAGTVQRVREAGFAHACVASPGAVLAGSDPLQLPRLHVEDWTGPQLLDRLARVLAPAVRA